MTVQFNKIPSQISGELDELYMINFVEKGQTDFNVTSKGSLDAFNSVFSIIKLVNPKSIFFKATDKDNKKAQQKSRIYAGYLRNLGYRPVSPEDLTPQLKKSGGEVYQLQ